MSTILIVDDDPGTRTVLTALLENASFSVLACAHGEDALRVLKTQEADLIVTDLVMDPGMDGIQLLRRVKAEYSNIPVVVITGYGSVEVAVSAMREGAFDFVRKPIKPSDLLMVVRAALQREVAGGEDKTVFTPNGPIAAHFGLLLGESDAMQKLYRQITPLCKTEVPILVTGEPGTEKAELMQVLYQESRRSTGPLFVVDFAKQAPKSFRDVLSEEYLAQGSNAKAGKQHLLETVALRNVHLMPETLQRELALFVKQKRSPFQMDPSGLPPDVRFLASSHKSLAEVSEAGSFNPDAGSFLSMVTVLVPPLRERTQDIPLLVQQYLFNQDRNRTRTYTVTVGAIQVLCRYGWPGNIDELHSVVDKAIQGSENEMLTIHDISSHLSGHVSRITHAAPVSAKRGILAQEYLKEQEKKYNKLLQQMRTRSETGGGR